MYSLAIVSVAAKFSLAFVYFVHKNQVFLQPCERCSSGTMPLKRWFSEPLGPTPCLGSLGVDSITTILVFDTLLLGELAPQYELKT